MAAILVADDDAPTRRVLELVLRSEGFDVRTAADGRAALAAAAAAPPDAIVVDLLMPELDGWGFCAALREAEGASPGADGARRRTPVLVLSARADEADRLASRAAGADDHLAKPFDPAELVRRLRALLAAADGPAAGA